MVLEAEATYHHGANDARNNVYIEVAVDASQREELKKIGDMIKRQVALLAQWENEPEQAMGVYLFDKVRISDGYVLIFRSDLHSAEEQKWIDLRAACCSDKDEDRLTFQLTIMTVDEAVAYWKQQKAVEQETGDDGNNESDEFSEESEA